MDLSKVQDAIIDPEDPFDFVAMEKAQEKLRYWNELIAKYNPILSADERLRQRRMSQIIYNPDYGPPEPICRCRNRCVCDPRRY